MTNCPSGSPFSSPFFLMSWKMACHCSVVMSWGWVGWVGGDSDIVGVVQVDFGIFVFNYPFFNIYEVYFYCSGGKLGL